MPRTIVFLLPIFLAGCGLTPPLGTKRLVGDVQGIFGMAPDRWAALPGIPREAATGWLDDFRDPKLHALVDRAISANPDLKAAAARVRQARAETIQAGADLFPMVSGSYSASRTQSTSDQRFTGVNTIANRFRVPLDVSWELDFWGRVADERRSARARQQAAAEDLHAAHLSLAANTVSTAVTLAEAETLLRLAQQNVEARRAQLGVLDRQLERGIDSDKVALDVSLSRADLARAEATVMQRRGTADQTRRSLEVLLGGYPAGMEKGLSSLPSLRGSVPAGLPSELLLRRPDLRAAERLLVSALNLESAAKKAFLPSIRLTGQTGRTSQDMDNLLAPDAAIWSIGANALQPIFQGGRLAAGVSLNRARYEEQLHTYASSALTAFREVETALAAERFLTGQAEALARAEKEAQRAEDLALSQYEKGLTDVLTLLDARQRSFDASSALIAVRAARLRNRVSLHLALGGEF